MSDLDFLKGQGWSSGDLVGVANDLGDIQKSHASLEAQVRMVLSAAIRDRLVVPMDETNCLDRNSRRIL